VREAEIHYLVKKQFLPVVTANPYIHKVHILEDNLHTLIQKIKKEHFDYVIDLHQNRSPSVKALSE